MSKVSNPYLDRVAKANIGDAGRASEKRVTKALGGRAQPASGAMEHAKGDFTIKRKQKWLAEAKSTTGDTLKLDLGWLMKINREALDVSAKPLLTISFVDSSGKLRGLREDWVCMPKSAFDDLTGD
jgi:hypothetical protein